jgi:hypothetical protein
MFLSLLADPINEQGSLTSSAVCVPPPGSQFMPGSSKSVMLCPSGTFKNSYGTANCTSCQAAVGKGFTTAAAGATSEEDCNELLPGYALLRQGRVMLEAVGWEGSTAGLSTKLCPQVCMGQQRTTKRRAVFCSICSAAKYAQYDDVALQHVGTASADSAAITNL